MRVRILPPRILWACNPDTITGLLVLVATITTPMLSRTRHRIESRVVVVVRKLPWMRCSQCQQAVASKRACSFGFVVVAFVAGIDTKRVRQQTEHQQHQRNTPSIGHDQKDGSCGGLVLGLWGTYYIVSPAS